MNKEKLSLNSRRTKMQGRVMAWLNHDPTLSQAQLAKATDMSPATLSTFLTGKCKPNTDIRTIDKLEAFFKLEDLRIDLLPEPCFVETSQARRIRNFISMIQITRGIGVLHGSSGIGKTKTTKKYIQDNSSVYYIAVNPMIRSKNQFFLALAWTILGLAKASNGGLVFDRIATKAGTQGALIVIDDAHLLYTEKSANDSPFEIIRTLNDRGIAFILAGNGYVAMIAPII